MKTSITKDHVAILESRSTYTRKIFGRIETPTFSLSFESLCVDSRIKLYCCTSRLWSSVSTRGWTWKTVLHSFWTSCPTRTNIFVSSSPSTRTESTFSTTMSTTGGSWRTWWTNANKPHSSSKRARRRCGRSRLPTDETWLSCHLCSATCWQNWRPFSRMERFLETLTG